MNFLFLDIHAGYGAAMSAQAVTSFLSKQSMDGLAKFHAGMILLHGVRLSLFVLRREQAQSFAAKKEATENKVQDIPLKKKVLMWLGVSSLYTIMYFPCHVNSLGRAASTVNIVSTWIGAPLMISALGWEALADEQKQQFKKENPSKYCDKGLWKYSCFANYFGEVAFWWASYLTSIRSYGSPWEFAIGILGPIAMNMIILSASKQRKQEMNERYKDMPGWGDYSKKRLVPFFKQT